MPVACLFRALLPVETLELERLGYGDVIGDLLASGLLGPSEPSRTSPWIEYNWTRARSLWRAAQKSREHLIVRERVLPMIADLERPQLATALSRRSCRKFTDHGLTASDLSPLLVAMGRATTHLPYQDWYIASSGLSGLGDGVYHVPPGASAADSLQLVSELDPSLLLSIGQGQRWVTDGSGIVALLAVNWARASEMYGTSAAAYVQLLIDAGRSVQAVLLVAYISGLAASMTPAVDEKRAAVLCALDASCDEVLYLVKFGLPRNQGGNNR